MPALRPKFTHGPDACKVALAVWLVVAPWVMKYTDAPLVVWNGDAVAAIVAAFSIAAMLKFTKWEEALSIVAGFWLFASPWLLDYSSVLGPPAVMRASANHLAVGLALVVLSLSELNLWELATGKSLKN